MCTADFFIAFAVTGFFTVQVEFCAIMFVRNACCSMWLTVETLWCGLFLYKMTREKWIVRFHLIYVGHEDD